MTCSPRCSSSGRLLALAVAGLAALGCGHRAVAPRTAAASRDAPGSPAKSRPAPAVPPSLAGETSGARLRVAVLPLDNASGASVPVKDLHAIIARRLATRFDVVAGAALEEFQSRHRLRYTGGIDADVARAARDELGLDALVVTTIEVYRASDPPEMGLTMRLVATGEEPTILWMEHAVRGGQDRPGLLRLGVLERLDQVRNLVLTRIFDSLDRALRGEGEGNTACSAGRSYGPRVRFRSTLLDDGRPHTVAVVPFLNRSARRNAGDLVALEFARQLTRTARYRVLEPGVVREYMLRARVMIPGGVSLETTRLFMGALGVDIVISGIVLDYAESTGSQGPTIRFSATMLDGGSGELVWHSTSFNHGDDGVFFFGLGRVRTGGDLTCRMVAAVVDRMGQRAATDVPPRSAGIDLSPGARLGRRPADPVRR